MLLLRSMYLYIQWKAVMFMPWSERQNIQCLKNISEELELLQQELVDEQELEKVKNKFESTQIFGNINYLNVATNLAWYELLGRAEDMEKEVDRYRSVTAEQLRAVAQSAFRKENGVILYYKKQQN